MGLIFNSTVVVIMVTIMNVLRTYLTQKYINYIDEEKKEMYENILWNCNIAKNIFDNTWCLDTKTSNHMTQNIIIFSLLHEFFILKINN